VARKLLKEHEARVTLKEPVVAQAARVTYDNLRTDLVEHYQTTESRDLEEAGWRLKHLDRAFRSARASLITAAAVTRYIVQRQGEKAANGTINREVAVLLRMLRLGLERGKVARVPIVHKPKEAAPRAGFFEADAFVAVRAHLPDDLRVAVTVAYTFGWRMQSEVLTLETRQLDLAAGTIRLDPGSTKNDEGRVGLPHPGAARAPSRPGRARGDAQPRDRAAGNTRVSPLRQAAPGRPAAGLPEGLEDRV
jgi:integrase